MNNLEHRLRQLHDIEPDRARVRVSRARLLAALAAPRAQRLTFRAFAAGLFRSGSAMALTGFLLLMMFGGFSLWKLIGPVTGLDDSLNAEAQAIDIQIHLADLHYQENGLGRSAAISARPNVFRAATASPAPVGVQASPVPSTAPSPAASSTAPNDAGPAATSTAATSTPVTTDDLLEILSH